MLFIDFLFFFFLTVRAHIADALCVVFFFFVFRVATNFELLFFFFFYSLNDTCDLGHYFCTDIGYEDLFLLFPFACVCVCVYVCVFTATSRCVCSAASASLSPSVCVCVTERERLALSLSACLMVFFFFWKTALLAWELGWYDTGWAMKSSTFCAFALWRVSCPCHWCYSPQS